MAANTQPPAATILRRKQVEARTGLSRTTIYDRINPKSPRYDSTFPKPISLGAGAVGWVESELNSWIESRIVASREMAPLQISQGKRVAIAPAAQGFTVSEVNA